MAEMLEDKGSSEQPTRLFDKQSIVSGVQIGARIVYAIVFLLNITCAIQFIVDPAAYAGAYQLQGIAGEAAVRGIGVAFLMWNATYPLFIWQPYRFMKLGVIIVAQQAIGLIGESFILASLPTIGFEMLSSSVVRFIAFDASGLVLMLLALILLFIFGRSKY